jgi:hypothetical protein
MKPTYSYQNSLHTGEGTRINARDWKILRHAHSKHISFFILIIKPTRGTISQIYFEIKLYMFRTVPLSIIRSYSLYTPQWCMSNRFGDSFRTLLESCCMTYTIAVCTRTVNDSWWWAEELSETCRVSFRNKFEKLLHLVGFIMRIFHDARSHECKIHLYLSFSLSLSLSVQKPSIWNVIIWIPVVTSHSYSYGYVSHISVTDDSDKQSRQQILWPVPLV